MNSIVLIFSQICFDSDDAGFLGEIQKNGIEVT